LNSIKLTATIPVIGVIGAIGAGKSTVSEILAEAGGYVIDADKIGHEVLKQPEVFAQLRDKFGPTIFHEDGTVNRRALGQLVFADPLQRKVLESIVFPRIGRQTQLKVAEAVSQKLGRFVVLDAAVMLEAGWADACNAILFVDAPREVRLARLKARSGWSEAELTARESAQLPLDVKKERSQAIIENEHSRETLTHHVHRLLANWGLAPTA